MHIQNSNTSPFPQSLEMNLPRQAQISLRGDSWIATNDEVQLSLFAREGSENWQEQQSDTRMGPGFQWNHQGMVRTNPNSLQRFLVPNQDSSFQISGLIGTRVGSEHRLTRSQSTENFVGAELQLEGQHRIHGPGVNTLLGLEVRAAVGRTQNLAVHLEASQERLELGADLKLEAGAAISATPTIGLESANGSHIRVGAEVSGGEQAGIELGGGISRDNDTGETRVRLHAGLKVLLGAQANLDIAIQDEDIENAAQNLGGNLLGGAGMLLGGREGARAGQQLGQQLGDQAADAVTNTLDHIPRFVHTLNRMSRDASQRLNHTFDSMH